MKTFVEDVITEKTISPVFQRAIFARGWVTARAHEIQRELEQVSLICKNGLYLRQSDYNH